MNANDPQLTAGEAQETIERMESARSTAIRTLRPPVWLNALSSLLFGVMTMAASFQSGSVRWTMILFLSAIAFMSTYIYWVRQTRVLGATARFFPSTFANALFYVSQAVFYGVVIIGSQALHDNGVAWSPYVGAFINAAVFSYLTHNYPTTEWGTRAAAQ